MDADLAAEHRRLVLEHGRQALVAAAVAVGYLAITAVPPLSNARTAGFVIAAGLLLAAHLAIVLVDRRAPLTRTPWSGWPLAALHGAGWTVIILLVWPDERDDQLLLLVFVVAWCAAVARASAPFVFHAALVMGPPIVATAVEFLVAGGRKNAAIAVGLALYAIVTILLHARASESLMRAIRLQIEHDVRSRRLGELALTDPLT